MRLRLVIDWEVSEAADQDAEDQVEETVGEEARRFAAAVSDNLEQRGVEDIQVRISGDEP